MEQRWIVELKIWESKKAMPGRDLFQISREVGRPRYEERVRVAGKKARMGVIPGSWRIDVALCNRVAETRLLFVLTACRGR
jgi:hypothetical protein